MPRESTQFKPGQSGNPKGSIPMPKEIKALRSIHAFELQEIYNKYKDVSIKQIKKLSADAEHGKRELPIIEHIYIRALAKALNDPKHLDKILDRVIGKPKMVIEHQGDEENPLYTNLNIIGGIITESGKNK